MALGSVSIFRVRGDALWPRPLTRRFSGEWDRIEGRRLSMDRIRHEALCHERLVPSQVWNRFMGPFVYSVVATCIFVGFLIFTCASMKSESRDDAYIRTMRENPPRCVKGVAMPAMARELEEVNREYGSFTSTFAVRADAPLPLWVRTVTYDEKSTEFVPPYAIGSHDTPHFQFDHRRDGYDGEFGHWDDHQPMGKEGWHQHACPTCNSKLFRFTVAFQYSGNNEELTEPARIARRQDYYSWFILIARCAACSALSWFDWECA